MAYALAPACLMITEVGGCRYIIRKYLKKMRFPLIITFMIDDVKKILQMLEALREEVTAIKTTVTAVQADVTAVKDAQQIQGTRLTALEAGHIALDLKVEAIHDYQKRKRSGG
jgi:hypothetical protein